jgi:hypothetical protein
MGIKNIIICFIVLFLLLLLVLFFKNKYNESFITLDNQVIPLTIYQTWYTKKLNSRMKACVDKLKDSNPEFTFYLYDDNECTNFIQDNFDEEVIDAYKSLIPGAYKADLWRYCILYKYGGIYLDIKYYPVNNFKFIDVINDEYFVKDVNKSGAGVYNALMICKPGNEKLLNCIKNIVKNVKTNFYGTSSLEPTGPLLLKKEFTTEEIYSMRLKLGDCKIGNTTNTCISFDGNPILAIYKDYYLTRNSPLPSYHELWKGKNIYA